ncbi:MAG: hypothetical protein HUK24_06925 [Sphaerochaetaceae bacterium]|nr:hypothetical protein [Sphaerochaetaceae bacterium]
MSRFAKGFTIVFLIFLVNPLWAQYSDPKLKAMGNLTVAAQGRSLASFNPASMFFDNSGKSFNGKIDYLDQYLPHSGETIPAKPQTNVHIGFASHWISLGLDLNYFTENERKTGNVTYVDFVNDIGLNIKLAAGNTNFSAGITIEGYSRMKRFNSPINKGSVLTDYLSQALVGEYSKVLSSDSMQVDLGFLYCLSNFRFGLLMDNILTSYNGKTAFTIASVFENTSAGVYYSLPEYGRRGIFNQWVSAFGFEIHDVFSSDTTVHLGEEITFKFTRDHSISFRNGFSLPWKSFSKGEMTMGLGLFLSNLDISLQTSIPLSYFSRIKGSDSKRWALEITFTYII